MARCNPSLGRAGRWGKMFWGLGALAIVLTAVGRPAVGVGADAARAAERAFPAVVGVRGFGGGMGLPGLPIPPQLPPIPVFPRRFGAMERSAEGSGVVVDAARGMVVTCRQVVAGSERVVVVLPDGRELVAGRVVADPESELVLLVVEAGATLLQEGEWGEGDTLREGEPVLALGRAGGTSKLASAGILSGRGVLGGSSGDEVLLTDALVNSPLRGGALVDQQGRIVGVIRGRGLPGEVFDGFGQAIPAERVRRVASELAGFGRVRRSYLGLHLEPTRLGRERDPRRAEGLLVTSVVPGGPADVAGIRTGDLIVSVDGQAPRDVASLARAVEESEVGREFVLGVIRGTERLEFRVPTQERSEASLEVGPVGPRFPGMPGGIRRLRPRVPPRGPAPTTPPRAEPPPAEPAAPAGDDERIEPLQPSAEGRPSRESGEPPGAAAEKPEGQSDAPLPSPLPEERPEPPTLNGPVTMVVSADRFAHIHPQTVCGPMPIQESRSLV